MVDIELLKRRIKKAIEEGGYKPSDITPSMVALGFNEDDVERALKELGIIEKKPKVEKGVKEVAKGKKVITTDIDRFFEFVKMNKKITMTGAAFKFGVDLKRIEQWTKLLKKRGKVDIIFHLKDSEIVYKSD